MPKVHRTSCTSFELQMVQLYHITQIISSEPESPAVSGGSAHCPFPSVTAHAWPSKLRTSHTPLTSQSKLLVLRAAYSSSPPPPRPERNHPHHFVAYCAFATATRFIFSRFHMPVARLRSVTKPTAAAASMIILVGLNWRSMPYSEAA